MIDTLHVETLTQDAINLLKLLIETESFSKTEDKSADKIEEYFREQAIPFSRLKNIISKFALTDIKDIPRILKVRRIYNSPFLFDLLKEECSMRKAQSKPDKIAKEK